MNLLRVFLKMRNYLRECKVVNDIAWLRSLHPNFRSVCSIVKVESVREFKNGSRTGEKEARYYIVDHEVLVKPHEYVVRAKNTCKILQEKEGK